MYSKINIKIALHCPIEKSIYNMVCAENPEDFQKLSSQNNTALLSQGGAVIFSETGADQHSRNSAMPVSPIISEKQQFAVNPLGGRSRTRTSDLSLIRGTL